MKACVSCGLTFEAADWHCPACGYAPEAGPVGPVFAPPPDEPDATFRPEHFGDLLRTESSSFWFRGRNRLILWALGTYFPAMRRFLEVGCGTGYVLSGVHGAFPDAAVVGAEIYPEGLLCARERMPGAALIQADVSRLPFASEFDVVGAFDVLEHIPDDEAALAAIRKTLRPGGGLVITVPQHPALWSSLDDYSRHQRRYTRRELTAKLEHAGFRLVRCTSFVSLLLPLLMLSRRRNLGADDPGAEFRIPAVLNWCFERTLDAERWGVRLGMSWPAGGSLLAVARVSR